MELSTLSVVGEGQEVQLPLGQPWGKSGVGQLKKGVQAPSQRAGVNGSQA